MALITGAGGGGCGEEIARRLAADGMMVVLNGLDHHHGRLIEVAGKIRAAGQRAVVKIADVASAEQVDGMVADVESGFGAIAVLVHNAAPACPAVPIAELADARWRADLDVILGGAFHLSRALAPGMVRLGWGRLVFISSSAAFRGARGRAASYSAAKAGLLGLAAHLALELGPSGVTANVIAPSQVDSPRVRRGGRRDDVSLAAYAGTVPVRRVGHPGDVAAAAAFLVSEDASYVTGQVLRVDGGSSLASPATATLG